MSKPTVVSRKKVTSKQRLIPITLFDILTYRLLKTIPFSLLFVNKIYCYYVLQNPKLLVFLNNSIITNKDWIALSAKSHH